MVVKDLIQDDFTENNLVKELESLLQDPKKQRRILDDLDMLKHKLGNEGASEKAAEVIINMIK